MRVTGHRTKFEVAFLLVGALFAITFVRIGQAGDSPSKGHAKIDCSYCHASVADIGDEAMPNLELSRHCQDCHRQRPNDESTDLTFHTMSNKQCGDCHSFHETDQITADGQDFRFRFDKRSSQVAICASCHGEGENPAMLSAGHRQAAQIYHSDYGQFAGLSPSQACMLCHSESGPSSDLAAGLKIPRFQDHGDHPLGVKVIPGSGEPGNMIKLNLDSRLKLVGGNIECQTCHSLSANTHARLRDFTSLTELCQGCHSVE